MPDPAITFDRSTYDRILEDLSRGRSDSPEWFRLRLKAEQIALSPGFEQLLSLDLNNIDEYPHQINAVLTALRRMRGRALLADEVGLGKTIEAGIILKELLIRGLVRKALILVPASLTVQWQQEMETKFGEEFTIADDTDDWTKDRIIASVDLAKRPEHAKEIVAQSWDLLVVDEAHKLRNRQSQGWKFVNSIKRKYILLLTATPVHNDLSELYSLVTLLQPGLLKTYRAFRQRYVDANHPLRAHNWDELKALLSEVMIRNRRTSVSVKFPPRTAYTYQVKLSQEERRLYDAVSQFARGTDAAATDLFTLDLLQREVCSSAAAVKATLDRLTAPDKVDPERAWPLRDLAKLAASVPVASKVEAVGRIVEKADDKVIVFTEFTESQRLISQGLKERGVSFVEFHGGLTAAEKNRAVEAFRNDAQVLVSTESGGEGRNLQFCNVMINYDLPWNPMLIEQRIGRIHRLGQTREVFVFNLAAADTIEAYILDLLSQKIRMFELVVGELDLILGNMETTESFEGTLRDIWFGSKTDDEARRKLDEFGSRIDDARKRFAQIKEAEVVVSKLFE
jgi:SNF2 family DNA or RNA helicase